MGLGSGDENIQKILKSINKLAVDPYELTHWITAIEVTARHLCNDKDGNKVIFQYCPDEKVTRFFVKDYEARDCLVKSIEIHLPLVPEMLQGFFSIFKYNLKQIKFEQ